MTAAELLHRFAGVPGVDVVPVLIEALDDADPHVRFDAAWSLQISGDARAREVLERHVDDDAHVCGPDEGIRDLVRRALQRLAQASGT